jgi:tRNA uridine 5-carbamoylmethylation protein Kti12
MSNIYMLIGFPGSGKTTWAREFVKKPLRVGDDLVIVNRDMFRKMLSGEYTFDKDRELLIRRITLGCIKEILKDEYDLIMDECNIKKNIRDAWLFDFELPSYYNVNYVWFKESDKNLEYRMQNSRGQTEKYWADVIDSMKKSFEEPTFDEPFCRLYVVENQKTKLHYLKCRCGFQGTADQFGVWSLSEDRFCPECESVV